LLAQQGRNVAAAASAGVDFSAVTGQQQQRSYASDTPLKTTMLYDLHKEMGGASTTKTAR
jgi:hypothetical protein